MRSPSRAVPWLAWSALPQGCQPVCDNQVTASVTVLSPATPYTWLRTPLSRHEENEHASPFWPSPRPAGTIVAALGGHAGRRGGHHLAGGLRRGVAPRPAPRPAPP